MFGKFSWVVLGMFIVWLWRFVRERGHAVFGVKDEHVQAVMVKVIKRYTSLIPLNMINSGGTHQQVLRGGTVIAWFDNLPFLNFLPKNVRSYVVWGQKRRRKCAEELVDRLQKLGHAASIHEPLTAFPPGTFLLVVSDAFLENGHAFRPHWCKMAYLEIRSGMKK